MSGEEEEGEPPIVCLMFAAADDDEEEEAGEKELERCRRTTHSAHSSAEVELVFVGVDAGKRLTACRHPEEKKRRKKE